MSDDSTRTDRPTSDGRPPEPSDASLMQQILQEEAKARLGQSTVDLQAPDDDTLLAYLEGTLDEAASDQLRDAFVAFPESADRLQDLQELLDAESRRLGLSTSASADKSVAEMAPASFTRHVAWRDFEARLQQPGKGWTLWTPQAAAWVAASLVIVACGLGFRLWTLGSSSSSAVEVQRFVVEAVRGAETAQTVTAQKPLALDVPLLASEASCETVELTLRSSDARSETEQGLQLVLRPVDGQVHFFHPGLDPGAFALDIADCRGGRRSLVLDAQLPKTANPTP